MRYFRYRQTHALSIIPLVYLYPGMLILWYTFIPWYIYATGVFIPLAYIYPGHIYTLVYLHPAIFRRTYPTYQKVYMPYIKV